MFPPEHPPTARTERMGLGVGLSQVVGFPLNSRKGEVSIGKKSQLRAPEARKPASRARLLGREASAHMPTTLACARL